MWFDCVVIDKVGADGSLKSFHIRAIEGRSAIVDQLEDIDPSYRPAGSIDMAGIRLYGDSRVKTIALESKLRNFEVSEGGFAILQLDHWHIPVTFGYYGIIFPKGFRVCKIHIYDPYDRAEDVNQKREYRGTLVRWDGTADHSCAQILMQSRRGSFSLGVLAVLAPSCSRTDFVDVNGTIEVKFTDPQHQDHRRAPSFRRAADQVAEFAKRDDPPFPEIRVGLPGISTNLNQVLAYAQAKWRTWKTRNAP